MVESVQSVYPSDSKAKEVGDPEADLERDQRAVYVSEIPLWATKKDINKFFSSVCEVRDIELVMDPHRPEKAVGYVKFYHPEYVSMAINLSGQLLCGEPINIEPVNARDSSTGESDSKAKGVVDPGADLERDQRTVYVSEIPLWATREDVNKFFSSVCKVRDIELVMDPHTLQKAVGYIEFYHPEYVSMAINLSGQLLCGEPINIEPLNARDPSTGERSHTLTDMNNCLDKPLHLMTSAERIDASTDRRELKDVDYRSVSYNKVTGKRSRTIPGELWLARKKADAVKAAQSSPDLTSALPLHTLFSPVSMQQETWNQLVRDKADAVEAAQSSPVLTPALPQHTLFSPVTMQQETSNQTLPLNSPQQFLPPQVWPQQYDQLVWPLQFLIQVWPQQYQQQVWPQQYQPQQYQQQVWPQLYQQQVWPQLYQQQQGFCTFCFLW
ncbi:hypothetical protein Vadar_010445 [Vaccinium darrowii]|uniref:Uncharacterized protein n=1 Tax=Vaccinium darrowii TaxID=229202 RepID=A0ACB7Z3D4_9ERIC|nr:hypothetical protein Vadar_010445 [Vaccinium darrowii]